MFTTSQALEEAKIIMINDYVLYKHCLNVAAIAHFGAGKLGWDQDKAFVCGLLHDIGKIGFLKITLREGPASISFMDHPVIGYAMLQDIDIEAATVAYTHHIYQHEKYPRKLEIDIPADLERYCQLIAYVDKVEAFMARSNYKPKEAAEIVDKFYPFMEGISDAVLSAVKNTAVIPLT